MVKASLLFLSCVLIACGLDSFQDFLLSEPSRANCRDNLFNLTRFPHVFGIANVTLVIEKILSDIGLVATMQNFSAWSQMPIERQVRWRKSPSATPILLALDEDATPSDPTSDDPRITPLWGAYSPGTPHNASMPFVNAVYANYCRYEDFKYLKERNVSVGGHIVICRYGKIYRGQKVGFAELENAIGVLIYSDPQDDGYYQGQPYPGGPARPESGGQRGSYARSQV